MKKIRSHFIAAGVVALHLSVMLSTAQAKLAVELLADPDIRTIPLEMGSKKIIITTRTSQEQVQFAWSLTGPGKLAGALTEPGIAYLPPADQERPTGPAVVMVTITTANGDTAVERLAFTFFSKPIFPECPAEIKTLEEIQKILPEHIQRYRTLKQEEKQGQQRNADLINVLADIICDLKAIEVIWEQKNQRQPSPELAENLRKTQITRQQYEKEWLDRVNPP